MTAAEALETDGYKRDATAIPAASREAVPGVKIVPKREAVVIRFGNEKWVGAG